MGERKDHKVKLGENFEISMVLKQVGLFSVTLLPEIKQKKLKRVEYLFEFIRISSKNN